MGANRLLARVGAGGIGTVYQAETPAGETVAVKVLQAFPWSEPATRFLNEFEKMKQVAQHPGIIRCHDVGVAVIMGREYPWYSMEFAAHGNLRARIEERRAIARQHAPWNRLALRNQIISEFRAVVTAVERLHQENIIHRDIKPDNVLIVGHGELRLSDFGLVKHLQPSEASLVEGPQTSTGAVLGTWGYMSPEQQRGQDPEKPTDVYSMAILLAELACGERPQPNFDQQQSSTLGNWRPLAELPNPLRRLIERCTGLAAIEAATATAIAPACPSG